MKIHLLPSKEISQAISMREAIDAVKEAFILVSRKKIVVPPRTHVDFKAHRGTSLIMPAYLPGREKFGVKIINLYEKNPQFGLPHSLALMLVFEAKNGFPLALLEASTLTAIRTGAACGLATDLLARKEAKVAAIFGAGLQGRYQLEAIKTVRPLQKVYVYDPDLEKSRIFAQEMSSKLNLETIVASTPEEACKEAEIISTATTASSPVFPDSAIKPGTHINAIGSYKPHVREVPSATVARARIFVDQKDAALEEAGDLLIPLKEGKISEESIIAEIGQVASGEKPGRLSDDEITFFKTVGLAAQDIALASLILEAAERFSLGQEFSL